MTQYKLAAYVTPIREPDPSRSLPEGLDLLIRVHLAAHVHRPDGACILNGTPSRLHLGVNTRTPSMVFYTAPQDCRIVAHIGLLGISMEFCAVLGYTVRPSKFIHHLRGWGWKKHFDLFVILKRCWCVASYISHRDYKFEKCKELVRLVLEIRKKTTLK